MSFFERVQGWPAVQRSTSTGTFPCVSTCCVSLPSSSRFPIKYLGSHLLRLSVLFKTGVQREVVSKSVNTRTKRINVRLASTGQSESNNVRNLTKLSITKPARSKSRCTNT